MTEALSPRVKNAWYPVSFSAALTDTPKKVSLFDTPIVLFRGAQGVVGALEDRCPHRNAPLSLGRIERGNLECPYHGWTFDTKGTCVSIPCLSEENRSKGRNAVRFDVLEQDHLIWVYATQGESPSHAPDRVPHLNDRRYTTMFEQFQFPAGLHATVENALDVPHTGFLHRGLFRKDKEKKAIEVVVTRQSDRVEAEYIGETPPKGLLGKLLAPSTETIRHFDRFRLPSWIEVEYSMSKRWHIHLTSALLPETDSSTRMFSFVSFRLPVPRALVQAAIKPLVVRILNQDAAILKAQTENIHRFGGEQYASTELDVVGPHILKLLRQAERGDLGTNEEPVVRKIQMRI